MNGLSEKTISQLHRVFESYKEIDQVLIYGSRAKGDVRPKSDINLTFRGSNLMLEIGNQIDDLLLPYKVDLSLYPTPLQMSKTTPSGWVKAFIRGSTTS